MLSMNLVGRGPDPWRILAVALALAASCGDDAAMGDGAGDGGGASNADRLSDSASQNPDCASLSGATAVYFDLESGFLVQLPFVPLLESVGGTVAGGDASFWTFPPGYSGQMIERGATISRDDGEVFFKQSSGEDLFLTTIVAEFDDQLNTALATFQLASADATRVCGLERNFFVGPLPGRLLIGLYDAERFRFIVKVQVIDASGILSLSTRVAVAPIAEFDQVAGNVFLPMVWAQFPGGSGPQPQCSDGIDNDGDLRIDFLDDPECTSDEDDDERNR